MRHHTGRRHNLDPVCRIERHFGLRRESRKAGDLLMLTDRRLVWITDRRRSAQEEYGTVARLAIDIGLCSVTRWSIPVAEEWRDAALASAEMTMTVKGG